MAARARFQTKQAVSAGGVVYRLGPAGVEVLLLETDHGVWGLPKGTPDDGETLAQTALREVREETGLDVALDAKVGAIAYWFVRAAQRERFHKYVHFWLMRPVGGSLDLHDAEHRTVRWFPLPEAIERITHANAAEILQKAGTLLASRQAQAKDTSEGLP